MNQDRLERRRLRDKVEDFPRRFEIYMFKVVSLKCRFLNQLATSLKNIHEVEWLPRVTVSVQGPSEFPRQPHGSSLRLSTMPFIPYQEHCTLQNGHKEGINVVSFSPNGDFLASGADDNTAVLWDVHNGNLLQKIITRSPVLSFAWNCNQMNTLFIGCQDGMIYCIRTFNVRI